MYYVYLIIFKMMYAVRLRKTSIRLARYLEQYCRQPLGISKLYNAIWDFTPNTDYPICGGYDGCWFPVLSDDDSFHESCRAKEAEKAALDQAEEDAYYEQLEAQADQHEADREHLTDLMDSFCTHADPPCFEAGDKWSGKCPEHDTFCPACDSDDCICYDQDDSTIDDGEDDTCEGICGQPSYACTCAELASYRAFQADPATRGSYWTA